VEPGLGLNGAVDTGRATIAGKGFDHVVDRPQRPAARRGPRALAVAGPITLVPDRRRDGTNVLAAAARRRAAGGLRRRVVRPPLRRRAGHRLPRRGAPDPRLSLDVDTPDDLAHPALRPHLPTWLRTSLDSLPDDGVVGRPHPSRRRRWRSAPIPTTSSSAPAARWPSGRRPGCVRPPPRVHRRARRARGTSPPTSPSSSPAARTSSARPPAASAGPTPATVRFLGCVRRRASQTTAATVSAVARIIASCAPRSCSGTTRGSATGCTPTTARRLAGLRRHRGRPRPALLPGARIAHHRPAALLLLRRRAEPRRGRPALTVERKLAALEAHESQFESTMHAADASELGAFRERIRSRLAEHGLRTASPRPRCSPASPTCSGSLRGRRSSYGHARVPRRDRLTTAPPATTCCARRSSCAARPRPWPRRAEPCRPAVSCRRTTSSTSSPVTGRCGRCGCRSCSARHRCAGRLQLHVPAPRPRRPPGPRDGATAELARPTVRARRARRSSTSSTAPPATSMPTPTSSSPRRHRSSG
jgi:hypothetical protein